MISPLVIVVSHLHSTTRCSLWIFFFIVQLDYTINQNNISANNISTQLSNIQLIDEANSIYAMPSDLTFTGTFYLDHLPYGQATMRATINVTVDVQTNYVYSVNSANVAQRGGYINFVSWETESITSTKNSPSNGYVHLDIVGASRFEYADPYTSITTGYTYDDYIQLDIACF